MADLARAGESSEPVHDIVRGHAPGLVNDDGSIHALL
jgi:hypothetical protein